MTERGNTKHGPILDDELKQEAEGMTLGRQPAHVEEARQTEPFVDDTDPDEVREALQGAGTGTEPEAGAPAPEGGTANGTKTGGEDS